MRQKKMCSTDPDIRGSFAALRRAARAARKLSIATGTPFYVVKKGRVVDLNAGQMVHKGIAQARAKRFSPSPSDLLKDARDVLELRKAKQSESAAPTIGLKKLKRRLGLAGT